MAENISFLIDESEATESEATESEATESDKNESDTNKSDKNEALQYEIYQDCFDVDMTPYILNFQLNFTLRQLTQICEYYNIPKPKKCNKDILIQMIIHFENDSSNDDIVSARKMMWFYMEEMKNDKYMKKYIVLW